MEGGGGRWRERWRVGRAWVEVWMGGERVQDVNAKAPASDTVLGLEVNVKRARTRKQLSPSTPAHSLQRRHCDKRQASRKAPTS